MERDWNHFWTGAFLIIAMLGAGCWALLRGDGLTKGRKVLGWYTVAVMSCLLFASLAFAWAFAAAGQGDTAEALLFAAIGLAVIVFLVVGRLQSAALRSSVRR